ncbi:hypothetical protein ACFL2H_12615, partial [Planctomycetota bacterium]
GSVTWNVGEDDSYLLWIWAGIDDQIEDPEDFKASITGGSGVKPPLGANYPLEAINTILETGVVDIDTDSNNDVTVSPTSLIEDGLESSTPKRIFVNNDDDNQNGQKDLDDKYEHYTTGINAFDKNFAPIRLNNFFYGIRRPWSALDGYKFVLFVDSSIKLWANTQKSPLDITPTTAGSFSFYEWTLGPAPLLSPPEWVYAEGTEEKSVTLYAQLQDVHAKTAASGVVTDDSVKLRAEKLVYPIQTQSNSNWQDLESKDWDGFEVGEAFHTDTRLVDYILDPSDKGTLTTKYPDTNANDETVSPTTVPARPYVKSNGPADLYSTSLGSYPNGFTMELDYTFDRTRGGGPNGYVQAKGKPKKLSFVANSGVKFGGMEAAILDVEAMINEGGSDVPNGEGPEYEFDPDGRAAIDVMGNVDVTGYAVEPLNKLLTGVRYGGDYDPNMQLFYDDPNRADSYDYFYLLMDTAGLHNDYMKIDTMNVGNNTFSVDIYLDEDDGDDEGDEDDTKLTYRELGIAGSIGELKIQSHWGSGVTFESIDVIPKP